VTGLEFNEPFYSTVAQVIPLIMALLFFESRLLKPPTDIGAITFFVPLIVLGVAEANALGVLYSQEPPDVMQRNIVISGLIIGIGSFILTPLLRFWKDSLPEDQHERTRATRALSFWAFVLLVPVSLVVLLVGDPLVTLSWIALLLIPLSRALYHFVRWREAGNEDRAKDDNGERRGPDNGAQTGAQDAAGGPRS
jgi:hypothetical protein